MTATRNDLTIDTEINDIKVTSHRDIELKSLINNVDLNAQNCVHIVANEKSVNVKSLNGKVNISASDSVKFKSTNGSALVKSDRSTLNVESYKDMEILAEQGDITIEAPNGVVNIRALNNINISPGNNGSVFIDGNLHATTLSQGRIGDNGLLVPTATVVPYCGASGPTGWFLCDGSAYSIVTYNNLFSVIGYTFGGSEGSTFNVPDLRGRLPLGVSSGISGFSNKNIGQTGGSETHTLSIDEIPSHTHDVNTDITAGGTRTYDIELASQRPNIGYNNLTTSSTGGGHAHSIMQPFMALNFIIKY
jgi:microcystin-dependent protein